MDEQRALPRWEIKREARVWLPHLQSFSHCIIEDMHLKGMCVSFDKQIPSQEPLKLSFSLGDNFDFIKLEARVPWEKESQGRYVYGLSFDKISEIDKDKMYQYLNNNCYDQIKDKWWA